MHPTAGAATGNNLPSLTGLRWVAAFLVFGYHLHVVEFYRPGGVGQTTLGLLFGPGSVGVSFFFILSGFVLMWSSPRPRWGRFWWRRFARVYPLHFVTALFVLLLVAAGGLPGVLHTGPVLANLFLAQSWSADVGYVQSLNTVSWTLSCEAFFYLLFPLLAAGMVRLGRRGPAVVAASMVALTTAGPAIARLVAEPSVVEWFFHWNPVGRLPEFVLGMTLSILARAERRADLLWWAAGVLTLAGYLLATVVPGPFRHAACTMPGFALVLIAAARSDLDGRPSAWRSRVMVRLGELSFAFYLVHLIVIRVLETVVGFHPRLDGGKAFALATVTFLLALGASGLLHAYVEKPARRLLLRERRRAVSPSPSRSAAPS